MGRPAKTLGQGAVLAFLAAPTTHGGKAVETADTHVSRVFLTGDRAFKLKKAVKLPYADFSTAEIRLANCQTEFRLNAPHAPGLYLGVRRITRTDGGGVEFDGSGPLVDAVVEMARFAPDALFDDMAERGRLTPALMDDLAGAIAWFHDTAPVVHHGGGADNLAAVLDINRAGFATSSVFNDAQVSALDGAFRAALEHHRDRLDRREAAGMVRRCHGDLHLRNICLWQGQPTLFDCLEFNDALATVDVLYDLAFLLMDLWARGLTDLANLVANRYFDATGADDGFDLLPFLMAIRAQVRAHVIATQSETTGPQAASLAAQARAYFDLAHDLLAPQAARAVLIGGLSGTGKTTVAEALAAGLGAAPGARIVESDRTRKALFGVPGDTRLPETAYTPEVSDRVYAQLGERGASLLAAGCSIIVDAVFDHDDRRAAINRAVPQAVGFWLYAGADTLRIRVEARHGGPSDATVAVLEHQLDHDPGRIGWIPISTDRPLAQTVDDIRARLSLRTGRS
jgi:aminoglycoside phosphotransferase family enzyme/predicted kinase